MGVGAAAIAVVIAVVVGLAGWPPPVQAATHIAPLRSHSMAAWCGTLRCASHMYIWYIYGMLRPTGPWLLVTSGPRVGGGPLELLILELCRGRPVVEG